MSPIHHSSGQSTGDLIRAWPQWHYLKLSANGSANVLRPSGSPLIWQNPKSTLHHTPRCQRSPAMWVCLASS